MDHADTIRRKYGADLPDAAHLLISVLEWGGVKELIGADLHARAHGSVYALLAERQQAQEDLEVTLDLAAQQIQKWRLRSEKAEAERQQAIDALRGLDEPLQWIAENYPAALQAMPREAYRKIADARAALVKLGEQP